MARALRHGSAHRPARIEVGRKVDGYRIHRIVGERPGLHTLAEGVNRAGERVTLDAIATPLSGDRELRRRIPRLLRTRGSIVHPHMLRLLRSVENGQRLHLQALPEGATTLAELLRAGPLDQEHALGLLGQVAGALETSRGRGLIHRQLSPSAIFVTPGDEPRALLTDFGIGVPRARACELAGAVEDAGYRSPEEIRGEQPDARSNVYSLACILVECLTGEPPYPCERPLLTIQAHLTEPPPKPSERAARLPEELDAVVATALAKDARERQSSAGALIRDCEAALGIRVTIPVVRAAARRSSSPAPAPARATVPAAVAAAAPSAAAEPRSASRAHATAEGRRPLRRLRMPRLRPLQGAAWAGIALMASGVAGFATGTAGSPQEASQPRQASTLEAAPASAAASYANVEQVVDRLNERRAAARRRLRSADTRPEQAAAARNLRTSYAGAYDALRPHTGPRAVLAKRVRAVEEAYAGLVAAARSGDPGTWRTARAEALAQERDLELLLRSGRWS